MTACAREMESGRSGPDGGGGLSPAALLTLVPPDARAPAVPALPVPAGWPGPTARIGFTVAADGSYAACLADAGGGAWYPERWTLGGPEPYTVPLPGNQPEEADTQVVPLPDGRVLIRRRSADRHNLALLYPTGPGTGELPVGFLHGDEVRLLPPRADGTAFALTCSAGVSTVWLVHGGPGLDRRAEVEGRCSGGVWLDRAGRMLALDREFEGRTKTVVVDVATGAVSPLLQITEDSEDRLLLADPDSGLLLVRSDAPGAERLGWGVLGSRQPVRFPECLREAEAAARIRVEPVAVQPGQSLAPESCVVLLRAGGRCALWRPAARRMYPLPVPAGWLAGSAWWSAPGTLRMPYADAEQPYAVRDITAEHYVPVSGPAELTARQAAPVRAVARRPAAPVSRVIPLQQAPLAVAR